MNILIIEDGHEYSDTLQRFVGDQARWTRAGSGPAALSLLGEQAFDAVYLDMRFDRIDDNELLGDLAATIQRTGDRARAVHYLQENQGAIILSALRRAGHALPVLFSYNFDEQPRRWQRMAQALAPVDYAPDNISPKGVVERLRGLVNDSRIR